MTISEQKQSVLLDLLANLSHEISILSGTIENDQNIPDDSFREYEKMIVKLYAIHNELNDEVVFS